MDHPMIRTLNGWMREERRLDFAPAHANAVPPLLWDTKIPFSTRPNGTSACRKSGLATFTGQVQTLLWARPFSYPESVWREAPRDIRSTANVGGQSASSSRASIRKLTGRKPSLQEIMAARLFFIHPS